MKKIKFLSLFLIIFTTIALSGCGPIYTTQYNYSPPHSKTGMMCINTCEVSRTSCIQLEEMKKENCDNRAELDYRWCRDHEDTDIKKSHCYRRYCTTDRFHCDQQYNNCYQSCGGSVNQKQVCTAFCK